MLKESGYEVGTIGSRLKQARKSLKLSQTQLANEADMSLRGYQSNERGDSTPSATILTALANLGISPLWILNGRGEMYLTSTGRQIYECREESEKDTTSIVKSLDLIFERLVEANCTESKIDNIHELFNGIEAASNESLCELFYTISEPFKPFILIPVLNPKDESGFHAFGSDTDMYDFHPVRRTWIESKKLDPKFLKAVFPSDDAMAPTLREGDIAIIDERRSFASAGIYALIVHDRITVRRLEYRVSGLRISTDSSEYSEETLSDKESDNLKVLGQVMRIDSYR